MEHRRLTLLVTGLAAAVVASMIVIAPAGASATSNGHTRHIAASGTTSFQPTATGTGSFVQSPELSPAGTDGNNGGGDGNGNGVNRSRSLEHTAPSVGTVPVTAGQGVSSTGPLSVLSTFDGLNHRQQRLANGGNQFSLEPPDQGLCVGNGVEMEIINDVMRVYNPNGSAAQGVEDLNTFFGYSPAIIRGAPNVFGAFITDPSCYYDKDTNRWFADVLTIDVFATSGDFVGTTAPASRLTARRPLHPTRTPALATTRTSGRTPTACTSRRTSTASSVTTSMERRSTRSPRRRWPHWRPASA
jgi:hypothetical protein